MSDKEELAKIGIKDPSFDLLTVSQLVKRGIIEKPLDGNHGEIHPKGEDFVISGIPFIMASDINNGVVDYINCKFITRRQADTLRKGFAKNGDVLLTHKATIGRTAIVKYVEQPYVMLTPQVTYYRVREAKKLNRWYLRYFFESAFFQDTLSLWAGSGSTRAYLGITEQRKLPFVLPPINKQQKIAAILSSYDALIENNQRRIVLLEKMAEEIYREWFVRLRYPGHKKVKVIKGVPEGWCFDKASIFFGLAKGKSYAAEELTDDTGCMPFVNLKSFNRGGGYREDGLKYYSGRYKPEQVVLQNDVVMAVTDMTQDRAVVGRVARIPDLGEKGAVISLDTVKLVPKSVHKTFLYAYMRHSGFADFIKEFANGANVLHLKPELITKQKIVVPPKQLQNEFAPMVEPLYAEADLLGMTNRRLEKMRDTLLPRLISGKLPVEDLDIHFPPSMADEMKAEAVHA